MAIASGCLRVRKRVLLPSSATVVRTRVPMVPLVHVCVRTYVRTNVSKFTSGKKLASHTQEAANGVLEDHDTMLAW
jgi:hypothetical protein